MHKQKAAGEHKTPIAPSAAKEGMGLTFRQSSPTEGAKQQQQKWVLIAAQHPSRRFIKGPFQDIPAQRPNPVALPLAKFQLKSMGILPG